MKNKCLFFIFLASAILSLGNVASAQPRVGDKVSEFWLQDTSDQFRGIKEGQNIVSILLFVGYN